MAIDVVSAPDKSLCGLSQTERGRNKVVEATVVLSESISDGSVG